MFVIRYDHIMLYYSILIWILF